jgi:uncharacterized protein YdhG (YjbR/CyaY superfamily)
MVQSKAATVDEYLGTVDAPRRETAERLRELCRDLLPGWQEGMKWGMPGYGPAGADPAVCFNMQKNHIALYAGEIAVERFADRLGGIDCGKGCVRYRRPAQIDFAVVADMLRDIHARGQAMC